MDPLDTYMFDRYPDEVLRSATEGDLLPDYVAVSHAGHGANSYFVTYRLVLGRVALFVQIGWGGAYMDDELCRRSLGQAFEGIAALLETAQPSLNAALDSGERLVALASERPVEMVGWLDQGAMTTSAADVWRAEHASSPDRVLARAIDRVLEAI